MPEAGKKAGTRGRPRGTVLSQQEFDPLAKLALAASMPPERIEAARLALVKRLPTAAIVDQLALPNSQTVTRAVAAMLKLRRPDGPKRARGAQEMTSAEFDQLLPLLIAKGTSERRITAARLALVERLPAREIAERLGWQSRQAVSSAKAVAWELFQTMQESRTPPALPPGWVLVTLAAPAEMAARFRREAESARKKTRP